MLNVKGVDHINLSIKNLKKSVQFYKDVFGFKVFEEGKSKMSGNPYAIIGEAGQVYLALYESKNEIVDNRLNHLGFNIEDFDGAMEKLKQLKVERSFGDEIIIYPESRSIYILDPDQIEIELSEKFGGDLH